MPEWSIAVNTMHRSGPQPPPRYHPQRPLGWRPGRSRCTDRSPDSSDRCGTRVTDGTDRCILRGDHAAHHCPGPGNARQRESELGAGGQVGHANGKWEPAGTEGDTEHGVMKNKS
eukprot:gene6457-biopygen9669